MLPAGLLHAASLALPGTGQALWWLQLISLALLCKALLHTQRVRDAAWLGLCFATSWLVGSFWWLFTSMHHYGGLPAPLAAAAVLALALFLALYYAGACAVWKKLAPSHRALGAAVFAACWLLAELARGVLWTGFPWGASGYAHINGPLVGFARWVGVYGISALAAAAAMLLGQLRISDLKAASFWALCGYCAMLVVGVNLLRQQILNNDRPPNPPLTVALLQGNIAQDEKFQFSTGIPLALQWYGRELFSAEADLVVAPETAIPLLPQQLAHGYLDGLRSWYTVWGGHRAALVGIPLGNEAQGYTNSVVGWSPNERSAYRYNKHHLVPFGEFVPPFFRWFVRLMNIPLGDFSRGAAVQPPLHWAGERIAPHICYEDLFTEELAARFADPAQAPTILANVSNIAWFGDSLAVDQHLHISQMRALELERPVVRATNTGATAIIDFRGEVVERLPTATRGVLKGTVQGRHGITPYARWLAITGLWPLAALALLVLAAALWRARHARPGAEPVQTH